MVQRDIFPEAKYMLTQFRSVCVTGPRQSGKTTLSRMLFKGKPYVSFENPSVQKHAEDDVASFMKKYSKGAILDEVQRVPVVFRQLQGMLDKKKQRGQYILTGSNNFLLQEQISQSLAGRAGYIELLPFSYAEIAKSGMAAFDEPAPYMFTGGYPEIWDESLSPKNWLSSYLQTYVQRDVRLLKNISDLALFSRFVNICANYAGQIVNRDEMARQVGVDTKTILSWLGLLENSYIIYLLQPWHNNLNKRILKSPKLYFIDTGLLCHLLHVNSATALRKSEKYGAVFENWIISEIKKNRANQGIKNGLYYFRDSAGNEVDLVTEKDGRVFAIEVKSTKKPDRNDMRGLLYWKKQLPAAELLLYHGGGKTDMTDEGITVAPWNSVMSF
ncbi:MAG: ATP-binding protein [Flavihumibacter sp.]